MKSYIVIGGGIAGASAAYYLSRQDCSVTLIDREDAGQATGAAAGIICPWLSQRRNKKWYFLVKEGAAYYPELIEMLKEDGETDTGYKKTGGIALHKEEAKRDKMIERALKKKEEAPEIGEITALTPSEVKEQFPYLTEMFYGVNVSGAARVDGRKLRASLVRGLKKNGGRLVTGDAALTIERNRATGARVNGEKLQADLVILAAGAWAPEVLASAGIDVDVSYQKAQIVHLGVEEDTDRLPVVLPPGDQYLLAFDDGRIVAGTTHENDRPMDDKVTAGGVADILSKTLNIAAGLHHAELIETRVGYRPFTQGFLPVAGAFRQIEQLLFINGLGSSGLTSGPFIGKEVAKMAIGEESMIDPDDYPVENIIKER
ncbi:NAD(P)/FAD-dependent oxidoreductase [Jeotgalibacillus haloalkalitolerans]|uniref:FAD-binding oxidoreductase n=1 Tax=Jeotgalibacillus haloalkalitolerans TaxID=3104292 RepID=A0ABU5KNY8_9BACL|nr:FAD-binding oxidoreductase [Jeotgalibacillus sp. HH7-29]MDZ5712972.1 FAD-binding oxidoreductase [Jeotgalibacillus sp. HH7-29]